MQAGCIITLLTKKENLNVCKNMVMSYKYHSFLSSKK